METDVIVHEWNHFYLFLFELCKLGFMLYIDMVKWAVLLILRHFGLQKFFFICFSIMDIYKNIICSNRSMSMFLFWISDTLHLRDLWHSQVWIFMIVEIIFHMFFNNGHIQKYESLIFPIYEILECEIFA